MLLIRGTFCQIKYQSDSIDPNPTLCNMVVAVQNSSKKCYKKTINIFWLHDTGLEIKV